MLVLVDDVASCTLSQKDELELEGRQKEKKRSQVRQRCGGTTTYLPTYLHTSTRTLNWG